MANFQTAFNYIIANEGQTYTNDIRDQGGPTKYGVTLGTLNEYMKFAVTADVKNLTIDKARDVYLKLFWEPLKLDSIDDDNKALAVFDICVNMGSRTGVKLVQQALGSPTDGAMGTVTLDYLNAVETRLFLANFIPLVQNYYIRLVNSDPKNNKFLVGWLKRSQRLIKLMI